MLPLPVDELAPLTSIAEAKANLELLHSLKVTEGTDDHSKLRDPAEVIAELEAGLHLTVGPAGGVPEVLLSTTSGLSAAHAHSAMNMCLQAVVLGYHHREQIGYTQDSRRWEGIAHDRKAWRGEFPEEADCSAYAIWGQWNGLDHFHVRDTVNGEGWRDGFTGTMVTHGRRVHTLFPSVCIIYGGGEGEHTTTYTGGGLCVSHGSQAGPLLVPWNYRSDANSFHSYIY